MSKNGQGSEDLSTPNVLGRCGIALLVKEYKDLLCEYY
jgi:hypothetical protein